MTLDLDRLSPFAAMENMNMDENVSMTAVENRVEVAAIAMMNAERDVRGRHGLVFTDCRVLARLAIEAVDALSTAPASPVVGEDARPIDMILYCPGCGLLHLDAPDERTPDWKNPPHKSHLCHGCGNIWRSADVPTNGVYELKTKGNKDTWQSYAKPAALASIPTPTAGREPYATGALLEDMERATARVESNFGNTPTGRAEALEEAAKIAETTTAHDDGLQKSAGCSTTGQRIAARIRALSSAPTHQVEILPKDVVLLVIAARRVMDAEATAESLHDLDTAAEAFADRVRWEDEPECSQ